MVLSASLRRPFFGKNTAVFIVPSIMSSIMLAVTCTEYLRNPIFLYLRGRYNLLLCLSFFILL